MAILHLGRMGLEVQYAGFDDCKWLTYHIRFLEDGEPFIKDGMLLGTGASFWNNRCQGGFITQESPSCSLIPVVENVLETNSDDCWIPTEPWFRIEFYPRKQFPFALNERRRGYSDSVKQELAEKDARRRANDGKLPDDLITVIASAITECWTNRDFTEFHSGPALVLAVYRAGLERFLAELRAEYDEIPDKPDPEE